MRNNAPVEHCVAEAFYFENRFANLIIIIRAISSPFYRQLLAELPIKSILHREIILTMKASFTLHTYLMSEDTSIAR